MAKRAKTRERLVSELSVCHSQHADKSPQMENLRVQYHALANVTSAFGCGVCEWRRRAKRHDVRRERWAGDR